MDQSTAEKHITTVHVPTATLAFFVALVTKHGMFPKEKNDKYPDSKFVNLGKKVKSAYSLAFPERDIYNDLQFWTSQKRLMLFSRFNVSYLVIDYDRNFLADLIKKFEKKIEDGEDVADMAKVERGLKTIAKMNNKERLALLEELTKPQIN